MTARVPTDKQYTLLLKLGSGAALVAGRPRDVEPLIRRNWVYATLHGGYYELVRITPDGLRALAAAVERYGLPPIRPRKDDIVPIEHNNPEGAP